MKKIIYILMVLACLPWTAKAQSTFTRLDWNELRMDSVMPVYTEVVPLETDYRRYDYRVQVTYPEWGPLSEQERAVAEQHVGEVADTLHIKTFLGVTRGKGLLDIAFVPVIRREGGFLKLLSGKIEILPVPKAVRAQRPRRDASVSFEGTRYADHSVLASGRWVKISVTEDGIYHLTAKQLGSMGFSDPARIRVYGYGGHRQDEALDADADWDDLEQVALLPVSDGYLFHANGLVHWEGDSHVLNHYARQACYFVTETEAETAAIATETNDPAATVPEVLTPSTFTAHYVCDPQEYAWFQGGSQLYESYNYASTGSRSYTINLTHQPDTAQVATLTIRFSAANNGSTTLTPSFNGQKLTPFTLPGLGSYQLATEVTKSDSLKGSLLTASNTLLLSTTAGNTARLNFFELSYKAPLRLDETVTACSFEMSSGQAVIEYAAGQQPQLWRLAEPGLPATAIAGITTEEDGKHYLVANPATDGTKHRYVVFDAAAYASFPQPAIVGSIDNQDLHAAESLEMVILTPASGIMDAQAERLAAIHREVDGMSVGVFRADQVYNEFSSGTPDATAYRRFMKMLYDRAADGRGTAPRYLLLFGDGAWDNRMCTSAWRNYSPDNFLLTYESENSSDDVASYVMEDYFGLLDDGEGQQLLHEKVDLGIGRFPVRTAAEAEALVTKTENYIRSVYAGAWKNVVCFLGDDGDNNSHCKYMDRVAERVVSLHPEIEVRKVIWDAYPRVSTASGFEFPMVREIILNQMEEGALLMNYVGHAATYTLSHEQVVSIDDFANFTSPRVPLWLTAACDVMPFDTQKDNIGETAILNTNAAAVAFFGTTRTVYANKNYVINRYFCDVVFDADEEGRPRRLGDAITYSKNLVNAHEVNCYENKLHFALLGDPALRLGCIQNRVRLDSINGIAVDDLPDDYTLHAGSKLRMAGQVVDAEGSALTDFTGKMHVRLYDSMSHITCLNADKASSAFTYTTYDKILYNGTDSVQGGRFALTCPIPIDIKYSNENGRLLFYAISNDGLTEANGYCEDFLIGGTEAELNDTIGPKITPWLGGEDFENGGTVCATPYLVASLEDESGINTAGNSLGHDIELIIDNDPGKTYNLNDYYTGDFGDFTRGTVAFSVPELTEGPHSLLLRAWDTQNNESHVVLDFNVDRSLEMHLTDLTASINPASTTTTFLLTHDRPGSECTFTIEVFDFAGRLLWTYTETGSSSTGLYAIPWGLVTGSGFPLGSGIYLYRARVSCGDSEEATKTQKLVIRRRF